MTDPYNALCNAIRRLPDDRIAIVARVVDALSTPAPSCTVHEACARSTWAIAGLGEREQRDRAGTVARVVEAVVTP